MTQVYRSEKSSALINLFFVYYNYRHLAFASLYFACVYTLFHQCANYRGHCTYIPHLKNEIYEEMRRIHVSFGSPAAIMTVLYYFHTEINNYMNILLHVSSLF